MEISRETKNQVRVIVVEKKEKMEIGGYSIKVKKR
jgi:hypothetical protein